ncbi:hypothetical protein LCGC14_1210270 [marine sediment metagenome]|uniref:Uncharacterized protein n=1 Tax=marine sediment metagenome TaxID=412755 RepID=A0A0F9LE48_9ZZZZ
MKSMKDRDARLYKFWLEHPDMSFQNIGNVFHIKHRQQVHAIIKKRKSGYSGLVNNGYQR